MTDFFGLAAEQIRRELLDLARHLHGSQGLAANHVSGDPAKGLALDPPRRHGRTGEVERH